MIATTLERSAHLIGSYLDQTVGELGVSQAEAHVLLALSQGGAVPIGALHRALGHKPSTLTNVVDRLERRDLARRESNPGDRRSVLIRLTGPGAEAADRVLAALTRLEDHIRATVAPRDIEGVENVTRALAAAVDSLGPEA
jgi:MarR family transcriptional regulator, organic hydroperoxide resistance regulator